MLMSMRSRRLNDLTSVLPETDESASQALSTKSVITRCNCTVGPQVAETIFDAGRRRAQSDLSRANLDISVADYRQTVLTAFQQVEDNLAALRILEDETRTEDDAIKAAQESLDVATYQYKAGVTSYLQVITAQTFVLQDKLTSVNIHARRMAASVLLIEALGGGWNASSLPTIQQLTRK
jgi:outer membrane protein TolC